jgi:hypothetical protein
MKKQQPQMPAPSEKLGLKSETVRRMISLDDDQLAEVAGGQRATPPGFTRAPTTAC